MKRGNRYGWHTRTARSTWSAGPHGAEGAYGSYGTDGASGTSGALRHDASGGGEWRQEV